MAKKLLMPYMNIDKEEMFGTKVTIFTAYIIGKDNIKTVAEMLAVARRDRTAVVAYNVSSNLNPLDSALDDYSTYNVMSILLSIFSLTCILDNLYVLFQFYRIMDNRLPVKSYCTFSLLMILLSNVLRFIKSMDIVGYNGVFDALFARALFTITCTLSLCSIISTYSFWLAATRQITMSLHFIRVTNRTGTFLKIGMIVVSFMLVVLDILMTITSYYGKLNGGVAGAPVVVGITLYIVIAALGLWMCFSLRKTVTIVGNRKIVETVEAAHCEEKAFVNDVAVGETGAETNEKEGVIGVELTEILAFHEREDVGREPTIVVYEAVSNDDTQDLSLGGTGREEGIIIIPDVVPPLRNEEGPTENGTQVEAEVETVVDVGESKEKDEITKDCDTVAAACEILGLLEVSVCEAAAVEGEDVKEVVDGGIKSVMSEGVVNDSQNTDNKGTIDSVPSVRSDAVVHGDSTVLLDVKAGPTVAVIAKVLHSNANRMNTNDPMSRLSNGGDMEAVYSMENNNRSSLSSLGRKSSAGSDGELGVVSASGAAGPYQRKSSSLSTEQLMNQFDTLLDRIQKSTRKAAVLIGLLSVAMLVEVIFFLLILCDVQYANPVSFGIIWVGYCFVDQIIALMEVRIVSISILFRWSLLAEYH